MQTDNNQTEFSSPRAQKARALFEQGYNCAQAVFLAFCDETGFDEKTAARIASSFGGGMGRLREVCGAVSGMFLVLGTLYGGILAGAGLGLVFSRGFSTGGTDAICFLLQLKFPQIPIGKMLMLVDGLVLASSVLVFHNIEAGLFGVVALFCQTKVIDSIVYGSEHGQMFFIVSEKNMAIKDRILGEVDRGATLLKAVGAYTMEEKEVLLCAASKSQFAQIKRIVKEIDPDAFFIVTEVSQILGEGFKSVMDDTL